MTRLKLFLKNSVKHVLLFSLILSFLLTGCQNPTEPTYKEKDIPFLVKKICKEEYGLEVTTQRSENTLWIYAPLDRILHKDYGIKEDKIFDEEMTDKLRNILTTIGRVLISSDYTPEFFALLVSDIKVGIDYTIVGCVLDIKKSYADFIPWPEANRRYVLFLNKAPEAVGDKTGGHLRAFDIRLEDFLVVQISQRIEARFREEGLKKYFKVNSVYGKLQDNVFTFEYSIEQIAIPPDKIDIKKEILNIVAYCVQAYDFKNFSTVKIINLLTGDSVMLNSAALQGNSIEQRF